MSSAWYKTNLVSRLPEAPTAIIRVLSLMIYLALSACQRPAQPTLEEAKKSAPWRDLEGRFSAVGKPVEGRVALVKTKDSYELHLMDVTLDDPGPVRVYLVGHDNPRSSAIVIQSKLKYDMAELEADQSQIISLPSRPDPALRSVVLWNPRYSANLATAPLQPTPD